jgi:hypothetical protein
VQTVEVDSLFSESVKGGLLACRGGAEDITEGAETANLTSSAGRKGGGNCTYRHSEELSPPPFHYGADLPPAAS